MVYFSRVAWEAHEAVEQASNLLYATYQDQPKNYDIISKPAALLHPSKNGARFAPEKALYHKEALPPGRNGL